MPTARVSPAPQNNHPSENSGQFSTRRNGAVKRVQQEMDIPVHQSRLSDENRTRISSYQKERKHDRHSKKGRGGGGWCALAKKYRQWALNRELNLYGYPESASISESYTSGKQGDKTRVTFTHQKHQYPVDDLRFQNLALYIQQPNSCLPTDGRTTFRQSASSSSNPTTGSGNTLSSDNGSGESHLLSFRTIALLGNQTWEGQGVQCLIWKMRRSHDFESLCFQT